MAERSIIKQPGAWTAAEVGGKEAFVRRLGPLHRAALDRLLAATRDRPAEAITRADFSDPLIDDFMAEAKAELIRGKGAVIIAGLPMDGLSLDEFSRIHWGLGTHLGQAAVQSPKGDLIGHVRVEPGSTRGYTTDVELRPHTDFHEIMSLAAFSAAESGGVSGLVSGLAIHNRIAALRPDLLMPLYEGWWHVTPRGQLSSEKVPVFSVKDGQWSVYFHTLFLRRAQEQLGKSPPPALEEAMALFSRLAVDPTLSLSFMLEPGEQLFWHNWTNLHSRTAFFDSASTRRHLLRLWLNVPDGRPAVRAVAERAEMIDAEHLRLLEPAE